MSARGCPLPDERHRAERAAEHRTQLSLQKQPKQAGTPMTTGGNCPPRPAEIVEFCVAIWRYRYNLNCNKSQKCPRPLAWTGLPHDPNTLGYVYCCV